jgi:hypothetical protein
MSRGGFETRPYFASREGDVRLYLAGEVGAHGRAPLQKGVSLI